MHKNNICPGDQVTLPETLLPPGPSFRGARPPPRLKRRSRRDRTVQRGLSHLRAVESTALSAMSARDHRRLMPARFAVHERVFLSRGIAPEKGLTTERTALKTSATGGISRRSRVNMLEEEFPKNTPNSPSNEPLSRRR